MPVTVSALQPAVPAGGLVPEVYRFVFWAGAVVGMDGDQSYGRVKKKKRHSCAQRQQRQRGRGYANGCARLRRRRGRRSAGRYRSSLEAGAPSVKNGVQVRPARSCAVTRSHRECGHLAKARPVRDGGQVARARRQQGHSSAAKNGLVVRARTLMVREVRGRCVRRAQRYATTDRSGSKAILAQAALVQGSIAGASFWRRAGRSQVGPLQVGAPGRAAPRRACSSVKLFLRNRSALKLFFFSSSATREEGQE